MTRTLDQIGPAKCTTIPPKHIEFSTMVNEFRDNGDESRRNKLVSTVEAAILSQQQIEQGSRYM